MAFIAMPLIYGIHSLIFDFGDLILEILIVDGKFVYISNSGVLILKNTGSYKMISKMFLHKDSRLFLLN